MLGKGKIANRCMSKVYDGRKGIRYVLKDHKIKAVVPMDMAADIRLSCLAHAGAIAGGVHSRTHIELKGLYGQMVGEAAKVRMLALDQPPLRVPDATPAHNT